MPIKHFDLVSGIYERWSRFDPHHPLLEMLDLPKHALIVDVGGGTGRVARMLTGDGRRVVIVDVSIGMLRHAHSQEDIWPVMADSSHLPFRTGSVERALIVDALHHIRHQQSAIDELYRLLKPGGVVVVDEPDLRNFVVKLIMVGEALLLMGSHFLTHQQLLGLFNGKNGELISSYWRGSLLVKCKKANK
ncbi:MAG: class I SAM-dependent methyltransferase [Anaerolineaceae bacterium]|nr:class I SAM-dependent methyltransferase [Anaerolineaceae bacterium]MBN2677629.1 class I SAM-dependent methyltransferase [Anaerolineaceae bacterium]